jgi:hypothetical protein
MEAQRSVISQTEWMITARANALCGQVGPDTVSVICGAVDMSLRPLVLYIMIKLSEMEARSQT